VNLSSEVEIKLPLSEMHITENEFFFFIRKIYLQVIRLLQVRIKRIHCHWTVDSYRIHDTSKYLLNYQPRENSTAGLTKL
jgi:hypothetical protein